MSTKLVRFGATVLGLGLSAATPLTAQTTTTSNQTTAAQTASDSLTLRDGKSLIGATLSTTGGRYGTIADLIYDGTGAVQYALVERQGQFHPVPFSLLQFGATGDVNASVSSATLDVVTVDRNNLQSLYDNRFGAQLRAAFGSNVARSFTNPSSASSGFSTTGSTTTPTTDSTNTTGNANANVNSTAAARNRVFSLAGLLGGTISGQNGEAGTITTIGINPNGTLAYAVGTNPTGDLRFAVPFGVAQLNANANGLSVASPVSTLTSISVPQGSLPTSADPAFLAALTTAFGDRANSFAIGGTNPRLSTAEMNLLRRNDTFNNDPVVSAGNSSQAGVDAIAGAGDSRRGGADAVSRAGDRASTTGTGTPGAAAMRNTNNIGGAGNSVPGTTGNIGVGANPVANPNSFGTTGALADRRLNASDAGILAQNNSTNGGIVNLAESAPSTQTSTNTSSNSGLIQMRDLLNFRVQAQDGAFGRISDIVFDRNGNVQYLLGSYQGKTFPLPFSPAAFSGSSNNTLSFDVPISTLQQLAINPQSLPTMQNQAFMQRMQQVFGSAFVANSGMTSSNYPANNNTGTTGTGTTGTGTTGTGTTGTGTTGTGTTGTGTTGTGTTGTGTTGTTGSGSVANQDSWTWPSGSTMPVPDPRTGRRFDTQPPPYTLGPNNTRTGTGTGTGTSGTGTGTGTGTGSRAKTGGTSQMPASDPRKGRQFNSPPPPYVLDPNKSGTGVRSKSGNTNNSGVGTGGRTQNPPPNGNANGQTGSTGSGSTGTGTGSGTTGGSTGGTGGSGGSSGGSGS